MIEQKIRYKEVNLKFFLLFLMLTSCGLFEMDKGPKKAQFKITNLNSDWLETKIPNTDKAFENKKLRATFYIFSQCDESYALSLEQSQKNILKDFTNLKSEDYKNLPMIGREALSSQFTGKVDGIDVSGLITNVQKDFCQFDLVLIETKKQKLSPEAKRAFENFMKGFEF